MERTLRTEKETSGREMGRVKEGETGIEKGGAWGTKKRLRLNFSPSLLPLTL